MPDLKATGPMSDQVTFLLLNKSDHSFSLTKFPLRAKQETKRNTPAAMSAAFPRGLSQKLLHH